MIAVLLAKNAQSNPDGIPSDWYIDTRNADKGLLDQELAALGYILMTEEEFEKRKADFQATFDSWNSQRIEAKESAKQTQRAQVDGYYVSLKTLRSKLDGEEKISESDLKAILGHLIDILIAKENSKL
jgi:hypothetical protein